jgi:hypothetical protein
MLDCWICHWRNSKQYLVDKSQTKILDPSRRGRSKEIDASSFFHAKSSQLLWTVLTFSLSRCNTATQFYVLRFFIGECIFQSGVCLYMLRSMTLRSCGKYLLPRNAIHHWLMVSAGWTRQTIMHFSYQQWYCQYVLRVSHGSCISSWRQRGLQRVAMVGKTGVPFP